MLLQNRNLWKRLKRFTAVQLFCFSVLHQVCDCWNETVFYFGII